MKEVVVITHGDCDGLCSASITLMKYLRANIIFSQPFALKPILNEWREVKNAEVVVILDLAYHPDCLQKLLELDREKTLIYIDHHPSSLELVGKLKNTLIDVNFSTSQLTAIYFQQVTALSEIGAICDRVLIVDRKKCRWFKEAELLRQSITYNPLDDDFRRNVVHAMAYGKLPSEIPEVLKRAEKSIKLKDKLVERMQDYVIYNNDFVVVDATSVCEITGRVGVVATELAIKYRKPVFIVTKSSEEGKFVITARAPQDTNIDLNEIMKKFGGGGHKRAASASLSTNEYGNIVNLLLKAVKEG